MNHTDFLKEQITDLEKDAESLTKQLVETSELRLQVMGALELIKKQITVAKEKLVIPHNETVISSPVDSSEKVAK